MSTNLFLVSSSPVTESRRVSAFFARSSSPEFPTLEQLVTSQNATQPTALVTSRLAKTASTNQCSTLAHASNRLQQEQEANTTDNVDTSLSIVEITAEAFKKPTKPQRKPARRPAEINDSATTEGSGKSRLVINKRRKKQKSPLDLGSAAGIEGNKQAEVVSLHFPPKDDPDKGASKQSDQTPIEADLNAPLNLDTALRRKESWTPPPADTTPVLDTLRSDILEILSSATKDADPDKAKELFHNLQAAFGYDVSDGMRQPVMRLDGGGSVLTKRKLIEMVSTTTKSPADAPTITPEKSPVKQKAPKKKPRTITGLATEAYAKETEPALEPSRSLGTNPKPAESGSNKSKVKASRKRARTKKSDPRLILLSPDNALQQVAKQDFVFGTSSQLAREEDAGLLRDIQAARRASNRIEDKPFDTPLNSDAVEPPEQRPRMWNAASRDVEGDLMDLEIIDLVDSPSVHESSRDDIDPFGYSRSTSLKPTQQSRPSGTAGPSSLQRSGPVASLDSTKSTNRSTLFHAERLAGTPSSQRALQTISLSSGSTTPPPSSQKRLPRPGFDPITGKPSSSPKATVAKVVGSPMVPRRPNFELMTDAQLARQVTSYGFKAIKRREAMIGLLDQCWSSKSQTNPPGASARFATLSSAATAHTSTALEGSLSNDMPPPPAPPASPRRSRGRPRKDSASSVASVEPPPATQVPASPVRRPRGRPRKHATTTVAPTSPKKAALVKASTSTRKADSILLEIPDSESDPASSPERLFSSSPPPYDISLATEDDTQLSLAMSPTAKQSEVFVYITKAVTSAAPSKNPKHPSWHEKILLYDPIILEDLAAWLNTGQLSKVGYDGEVSPQDIKKWCESKSICCLWRERAGGKQRKRL